MSAGIRRAELRDLERVAGLWLDLAEHHAALDSAFALGPRAEPEAYALVRSWLRDPGSAAFLAEQEGRAVGLCILHIARAPAIARERERAEITDLLVEPAARRRGLGRRLVESALAFAGERGVERIRVHVAVANREAQAFWRALGFGDLMDVLERRL
jgi:ribosomal protein S18 acetylase RimI-like enzyme